MKKSIPENNKPSTVQEQPTSKKPPTFNELCRFKDNEMRERFQKDVTFALRTLDAYSTEKNTFTLSEFMKYITLFQHETGGKFAKTREELSLDAEFQAMMKQQVDLSNEFYSRIDPYKPIVIVTDDKSRKLHMLSPMLSMSRPIKDKYSGVVDKYMGSLKRAHAIPRYDASVFGQMVDCFVKSNDQLDDDDEYKIKDNIEGLKKLIKFQRKHYTHKEKPNSSKNEKNENNTMDYSNGIEWE